MQEEFFVGRLASKPNCSFQESDIMMLGRLKRNADQRKIPEREDGMRAKPDLRRSSAQLRGPSHISVGAWSANLLPKSSYEATYIPQLSVIGFAFEEQTGVHAIGTSRRSRFKAQTHALAYVPRGCDVFSQSDQGGEYLTVTCFPRHPSRKRTDRAFTNRVDPIAVAAAYKLRKLILSQDGIDLLFAEHLLVEFAARADECNCSGEVHRQANGWMTARRLKLVVELIEARLESKLTLQELASSVGLSVGFFSRAFKAATGMAPQYYIIERRVARARSLVATTKWDLSEISHASGFASHAHMTATFRSRLGVSPNQLRNAPL